MRSISKLLGACLAATLLPDSASAETMYNPQVSAVTTYNPKNFDKQVLLNREKGISVVQFYKAGEESSTRDKGQYEKFGLEQKKMLRIGAVDCVEWSSICEKEGVTDFPTYRVYPPFPIPHADLHTDAELDTDKLKKMAFKHIGNRAIEITAANHDVFKEDNPGKPKVLLFTDKQKTPIVFRALSTYFDKTLEFGMIKAEEESLVKKYKVKDFPSVFILKHGEKAPIKYKGSDFTYSELFEFINTYSETFVFKQDEAPVESSAKKPWLATTLPFLAQESANDLCLKKDGILCVIYAVPSAEQSDQAVVDALASVKETFTRKIERGIQFSFMRLDAGADSDFAGAFGLEDGDVPGIVILNPGKKKRYLKSEYALTEEGITQTLDKILGGDARFKMVKGNKLPELTSAFEAFVQ